MVLALLGGMFIGETIALGVAVAWTATAMLAEVGSKRMGSLPLNTVRMTMSLSLLVVTLWLADKRVFNKRGELKDLKNDKK